MTTPNRSEAFGRLLKAGIASIANCEGKTAPLVEDDLGTQIGVVGKSIQRYKAGYLPPDPRTVQILAEVCVRRGMMGREWLEALLHAARYPFADRLLDQLRPLGPARPRPPRIYENLPAPTYNQFIMREQAFAEVIDGLQQRSAAVLVIGLGGNGKTSLAREVAARCLREDNDSPRFDAVVWVSDKDRPGTTNLSIVLDEIARTLDYPGFTQFEHDEKRREVEQLLRRQKVLLVVDNFETISDGALLTWMLRLPEPSKALITTREYRREFRRSGWPVELRGMSEGEIRLLIDQRLRQLRIEKLVGSLEQLEPLITATGGNPKAIEITLGLVKHERHSLQQVVDDIYAARGDLFGDLFARAWGLLDEAARRVLLVATFFPASASAEALRATADVQGFSFNRTVERLTDLALLDVQQKDLTSPPRYVLHPLVRAFAKAKLVEQIGFEEGARERWVEWYVQLVSQAGYCWYDLKKLNILDTEINTIYTIIQWCFHEKKYAETMSIVQDIFFYCNIRGLWNKQPSIYLMAAEAARKQDSHLEEILFLSLQLKYLSWQDNIVDGKPLIIRLSILESTTPMPDEIFLLYRQASAFHYIAQQDFSTAQRLLQGSLSVGTQTSDKHGYNASKHWIAVCLYRQGYINEAKDTFREAIYEGIPWQVERAKYVHSTRLIEIYLDQDDLNAATEELERIDPIIYKLQDRRYVSLTRHLTARLHTLRGDIPAARAALAEAIDLFERLGMRRELAEARADLARLDAPDAPVGGASGAADLSGGDDHSSGPAPA